MGRSARPHCFRQILLPQNADVAPRICWITLIPAGGPLLNQPRTMGGPGLDSQTWETSDFVSHISKSRCGAPIFLHYWLGRLGPPVVNGQRWATRRQAEPVGLEAHRTADQEAGAPPYR